MVTTRQETDRSGTSPGAVDYLSSLRRRLLVEKAQPRWPYDEHDERPETSLRGLRDRPFRAAQGIGEAQPRGDDGTVPEAAGRSGWGGGSAWAARAFLGGPQETREVLVIPLRSRAFGRQELGEGTCERSRQLLPMLDLRQFLGSGATASGRNTRVVVVNHRGIPAGLVVDEVLGSGASREAEFNAEAPPTVIRCDSYLAGPFAAREVCRVELEEVCGE